VLEREPKVNIELEWTRPTNTYGELLGYKLRYGIRGQEMFEIMMTENKRRIPDLGKSRTAANTTRRLKKRGRPRRTIVFL